MDIRPPAATHRLQRVKRGVVLPMGLDPRGRDWLAAATIQTASSTSEQIGRGYLDLAVSQRNVRNFAANLSVCANGLIAQLQGALPLYAIRRERPLCYLQTRRFFPRSKHLAAPHEESKGDSALQSVVLMLRSERSRVPKAEGDGMLCSEAEQQIILLSL